MPSCRGLYINRLFGCVIKITAVNDLDQRVSLLDG